MIDIKQLVTKMTLEEKISLLAGVDLWETKPIPRLGIPAIKVTDGPNGARGALGDIGPSSALFPVGSALGATWNPDLVESVGAALAGEAKAKGAHVLLGPTVNIQRVPVGGRNFECYSEDPYLSGKIASAYIRGLQANGVAACIKHFVCNDQEFERMSISVEIDERTLHEIYLEPFRRALAEAKPWSIMSSYNRLNGVYASENPALLKRLLKEQWKFDGLVISDWKGTYSDKVPAGGLDLEMPGPARWMGEEAVRKCLADGTLTEAELNDTVSRLLRLMERVGAFSDAQPRKERSEDTPQQRTLIRKVAQETIVLLKNESTLLPLDPGKVKKIAVIGELADRPNVMGGGSSRVSPHYVVSPLAGIRERAGETILVHYAPGCPVHRKLPAFDRGDITNETGEDPGLTLRIYDNLDFSGAPAFEKITDKSSYDWWGPAVPNADQTRFCARLTGTFTARDTGMHTFGLSSIGRSRFLLGGELLIDNSGPEISGGQKTAQKLLAAGQKIQIQVDYQWNGDSDWRFLQIGHRSPVVEDPIAEAVALAKQVDAVIVVAGLTSEWESEGFDRPNMSLSRQQDQLIEAIAAANSNTIVVLNTGSPISMPWAGNVRAILQQWYNSQECGNALADILFGDVNPSGKLPTTFPVRYEDNPTYPYYPGKDGKMQYGEGLFVGYRHYDVRGVEPLFGFGYGLSYTTFEFSEMQVNAQEFGADEGLDITVKVRNAGARAGKEVVQLYVADLDSQLEHPQQELRAFQKVALEAGEQKTVRFHLDQEAFRYYDAVEGQWATRPGEFEIRVGNSSRSVPLRRRVRLFEKLQAEASKREQGASTKA